MMEVGRGERKKNRSLSVLYGSNRRHHTARREETVGSGDVLRSRSWWGRKQAGNAAMSVFPDRNGGRIEMKTERRT